MSQRCCIEGCRHHKKTSTCSFKKFPSDPQKSKVWETLVRRSVGSRQWKRSPCDRICECHFENDQFELGQDGYFKLRLDAQPHLFGSKAKLPSHCFLVTTQRTVISKPGADRINEISLKKKQEDLPKMSSTEVSHVDELTEKAVNVDKDEQIEYRDASCTEETSLLPSEGHLETDRTSKMREVARAGISVIASTADAEAYLYDESKQEGTGVLSNSDVTSQCDQDSNSPSFGPVSEEPEADKAFSVTQNVTKNQTSMEYEESLEFEAPADYEESSEVQSHSEVTSQSNKNLGPPPTGPASSETGEAYSVAQTVTQNETSIEYQEPPEFEASAEHQESSENEATVENLSNEGSTAIDNNEQRVGFENFASIEMDTGGEMVVESEVIPNEVVISGEEDVIEIQASTEGGGVVNLEGNTEETVGSSVHVEIQAYESQEEEEGEVEKPEEGKADNSEEVGEVDNAEEGKAENAEEGEIDIAEEEGDVDNSEEEGEVDNAEEVGEVDNAEEVGEVDNAEEVGEVDNAEEVGEVDNAEEVGDVDNAEEVGEVDNAEEVGEVDNAEGVGEVDSAEEVGEVDNAEEVGQVDNAEEVGEVDNAEEVGEVDNSDEETDKAVRENEYEPQEHGEGAVTGEAKDEIREICASKDAVEETKESNEGLFENQQHSQEDVNSGQLLVADKGEEGMDQDNFEEEGNQCLDQAKGILVEESDEIVGEGDMEDDGVGEEFTGEEEDYEDGEEMGDEVEVEIEDCSDPEMETEGGITYIISEGMIVVEENESSEAFHSADNASSIDEEHIICDEQIGGGQKTTRIVIKMPSSKSGSGAGSSVTSDQAHTQEAVLAEVFGTDDSNTAANYAEVDTALNEASCHESEAVTNHHPVEDADEAVRKELVVKVPIKNDETLPAREEIVHVAVKSLLSEGSSKNCDEASVKNNEVRAIPQKAEDTSEVASTEEHKSDGGNEEETAGIIVADVKATSAPNGETAKSPVLQTAVNKSEEVPGISSKNARSEEILKQSKPTSSASVKTNPTETLSSEVSQAPSNIETKSSKTVSNTKGKPTQEKVHSESTEERRERGCSGNDVSKHAAKHSHSPSHRQKIQISRTSVDEKSSTSIKSTSKHETVRREEHGSKVDLSKKQTDAKDLVTRSSHLDRHHSKSSSHPKQTANANHRTRSNSTSSKDKEPSLKDKRSTRKDDASSKKSHTEDHPSTTKRAESDGKVGLRSSRSRKSHSEAIGKTSSSPEPLPQKKDKGKSSVETPLRQRQSERVSKATEKAIASGLLNRRSRSSSAVEANNANSEKPPESGSDDQAASQRRSKRKAEFAAAAREETPVSKRRTTRSGEAQTSTGASDSPVQSRSARKGRGFKRRGSSSDLPPAKQAHTEEISPKVKVTNEFIANIPKMCRICGSNNDNLLNVFGPEGRTMQLSEKVHNILPIKMRQDEPLPTGVCHSCVVTLIACEKLVEKCTSLDNRLRAHFKCPIEKHHEGKIDQKADPPSSDQHVKPEKAVKCNPPSTPQPATKPVESPVRTPDEMVVSKSVHATRSSSRVSAKHKQVDGGNVSIVNSAKSAKETPSLNQHGVKVISGTDAEDSPPVLEAEPPQSQVPTTNQEPLAQPPILVPQPAKSKQEVAASSTEDSAAKRFGNTYRARMKPGQWEKIEKGLEAIHGEVAEDDQETSTMDVKPIKKLQTEEYHIVGLEMNVQDVPPEAPAIVEQNVPVNVPQEFHIEIPTAEEANAVQQSSPKSVIDSILVDWSGDEDVELVPVQNANTVSLERRAGVSGKDVMNGSIRRSQVQSKALSQLDDNGVTGLSQGQLKSDLVVVKQESFWPEPAPGSSTTSTSDKPQGDVPWKCFVCGKRGKSLSKFLEHKKLHLNDRKLVSCPKCSESFSNQALLKSHMKAHHGDDDDDEVVVQEPKRGRQKPAVKSQDTTIVDVDLAPATDGLYHCSSCQSAFASIESLCQHKLIHQQTEAVDMFKCSTCKKTFYNHKDFQSHMASHQPSTAVNMFQCGKCNMKMTNQKEFIEHIDSHSSNQNQNFTCDLCNKEFDTKHKLRSHRSTVHKSTAYACHLCDKVCHKRITLIEHLRKHSGDNPFACPVCNKRFNRLANYKAHMTIHENARRYECPYCGKRFNRQSIQQRHIKTHTSVQSRKHRCRVCNLTFGLATEMFQHRKLHTREEVERATWEDEKLRLALTTFPCKVCQVPYNSVDEVCAHMLVHTDEERDVAAKLRNPKLECDICGKVLNSKRTFTSHRSSHIDGKPFVCKICSKGYSTSTGLNYHMLSHTGERPFPCTFCHRGYKNSTDLKVHMRQHTGEFPYKCNKCNKAFRSASSLQKHGFVHTEVRAFKCKFCSMSFKREGTKNNHERIHTNDRRHKCKVCARTFIQKGACDAHEKLHFRGGTQLFINVSEGAGVQREVSNVDNVEASSSKSKNHDLFEDFEEEDFDEDDDDEDEYIIYEDEDGVDDDDGEDDEETIIDTIIPQNESDGTEILEEVEFEEPPKSSNGVDLPDTDITPIPLTVSSDTAPSVGDNSVHITIL